MRLSVGLRRSLVMHSALHAARTSEGSDKAKGEEDKAVQGSTMRVWLATSGTAYLHCEHTDPSLVLVRLAHGDDDRRLALLPCRLRPRLGGGPASRALLFLPVRAQVLFGRVDAAVGGCARVASRLGLALPRGGRRLLDSGRLSRCCRAFQSGHAIWRRAELNTNLASSWPVGAQASPPRLSHRR